MSLGKTILQAGLLAGILDITADSIQAYLMRGTTPGQILQFIASGAFGPAAFEGGTRMMLWGLLFHFLIATSCAICFFLLYRPLHLFRLPWWMNAILIGIVAWVVTNLIILPLSRIGSRALVLKNVLMAVGILMVCIGVPVALIARNYFVRKEI
jgi:hypothetical protein